MFDVPAQPLASALELFSVASGWQVIYDADLATGRRSTSVRGELPPAAALRLLLTGTGLIVDHVAADGVMLVPDPSADPARRVAGTDTAALRGYYGHIQVGLRQAFCAAPELRAGGYRIALGLWIGSSGEVTRAELLGSTGSAPADHAFDRALRTISIGEPPPPGFNQPVFVLVTPDLVAQCGLAEPRLQATGVSR